VVGEREFIARRAAFGALRYKESDFRPNGDNEGVPSTTTHQLFNDQASAPVMAEIQLRPERLPRPQQVAFVSIFKAVLSA
jgi:hypothetical protein